MTKAEKPEVVAPVEVVPTGIDKPAEVDSSQKYELLSALKHNGRVYEVGATVSLPRELGEHLADKRMARRA